MTKTIRTSIQATPEQLIIHVRGQSVMLDSDLAALYGVPTGRLNENVKRNIQRFPGSFMFQLTEKEWKNLRSQFAISRSHGGRRYLPNVFTEHGALMAANILNSEQAIGMSIAVINAFVKLRRMALSIESLARKVNKLENQYDENFRVVFEAIRQLMQPPETTRKKIGFHAKSD